MAASGRQSVYVLQLKEGKYYVGTTTNLKRRLKEHAAGRGRPAWTTVYPPVGLLKEYTGAEDTELTVTLRTMHEFDIENVRGSAFCQVKLSDDVVAVIRRLIPAVLNLCYKCGGGDHYSNLCLNPTRRQPSERCGYTSHSIEKCFAKGYPIHRDSRRRNERSYSSSDDDDDDDGKY